MSINLPHTPQPPNLRNKKNKLRRKKRHQYKITHSKKKHTEELNNRLNHNQYNTWDSETIKPFKSTSIKTHYTYYKVMEELKDQLSRRQKLVMYIDNTYEHISSPKELNEYLEEDRNKNTCILC